jgi:ribosomal protein L2
MNRSRLLARSTSIPNHELKSDFITLYVQRNDTPTLKLHGMNILEHWGGGGGQKSGTGAAASTRPRGAPAPTKSRKGAD